MNRITVFLILAFPCYLAAQNTLEFVGEKIDFSINSTHFNINGIYVFVNNTENEITQAILFPISNNMDSFKVKRVYNLTYNENIPYQQAAKGITFNMSIAAKDTVSINISYWQNTVTENIYILKSTRTWNEPLQKASYSLLFDNSVTIDSISFEPDALINNVYYWTKTDFYPNKNFIVWIK